MPNVFSHPYQLDESISNLGLLGGIFHFYSYYKRNLFANSGEPDQTPHFAASDLVLHGLPISNKRMLGLYGLKLLLFGKTAVPVLCKVDLIFKDFSRKPCSIFKNFSSLWEHCHTRFCTRQKQSYTPPLLGEGHS